ncbi:zinc finger protein ZPR1 [Elysia marginata]|uniref:Zinc finger protein ZPR1 n=1 Tax=Elysia marginata TaxID=1093978 RepID=A0AAV4GYV3_9GAST|nr:zinc finger protein ZPR1 [Elysia marginata]
MNGEAEPVASSDTLTKPLFRDITADDYDPEITEIESLCLNCEAQGITRLFLTRIPFFREVIVSSFSCDECGYKNAELQPGGQIQDRGVSYKLTVKEKSDINRQVVQTQYATIKVPHLEFEIPPGKAVLTTVEGIIDRAVEGLEQDQVLRRIQHPEIAAQIDAFVDKLKNLKEVETSWQMVLTFATNCPNCGSPCDTNMKLVNIPFFKEVIIMATTCDKCGLRENEVKSSGGVEPKGQVMSLVVNTPEDMARDVLKSETASLRIPELDFDMEPGTLGGKFTTVEGLLQDVKTQVNYFPFFPSMIYLSVSLPLLKAYCRMSKLR